MDADDDVNPLSDNQIRILLDEKFEDRRKNFAREVQSDAGSEKTNWEEEEGDLDKAERGFAGGPGRGTTNTTEQGPLGGVLGGQLVDHYSGPGGSSCSSAAASTADYGSSTSSSSSLAEVQLSYRGTSRAGATTSSPRDQRSDLLPVKHQRGSPPVEHYHIGSPEGGSPEGPMAAVPLEAGTVVDDAVESPAISIMGMGSRAGGTTTSGGGLALPLAARSTRHDLGGARELGMGAAGAASTSSSGGANLFELDEEEEKILPSLDHVNANDRTQPRDQGKAADPWDSDQENRLAQTYGGL